MSPVAPVALPAAATLTAEVADDGLPAGAREVRELAVGQETPPTLQPSADEPRAPVNVPVLRTGVRPSEVAVDDRLTITWSVLRGPASVAIEADSREPDAGARAPLTMTLTMAMTATFGAPGEYLLRASLSDGHLTDVAEIDVRVE